MNDGDFQPDPQCYPDIKALSDEVRTLINATTVFSFWPEVKQAATEFPVLQKEGCLINADLGGLAIDPTTSKCRDFIWSQFLKPRCRADLCISEWRETSVAKAAHPQVL